MLITRYPSPVPAMVIGLTGGIATGKSAVARILEKCGASMVDADHLSHALMEPGKPANRAIGELFPTVVLSDETIDRRELGRLVFEEPSRRRALEDILHPAVIACIEEIVEKAKNQGQWLVLVVPLLFETGLDALVDEVWVVEASRDHQLQRLMNRDRLDEKEAERRIESQWPLERKVEMADVVIDNDGSPEELEKKVEAILRAKGLMVEGQG